MRPAVTRVRGGRGFGRFRIVGAPAALPEIVRLALVGTAVALGGRVGRGGGLRRSCFRSTRAALCSSAVRLTAGGGVRPLTGSSGVGLRAIRRARLPSAIVLAAASPAARAPSRRALTRGLVRLAFVTLATARSLCGLARGRLAARAVRRACSRFAGLAVPAALIPRGPRALTVARVLVLGGFTLRFRASAAAAPPPAPAPAPAPPAPPPTLGACLAAAGRAGLAGRARARLRFLGRGRAAAVQPTEHPLPDARLAALCRLRLRGRGCRQHVLHGSLLGLDRALDLLVRERRVLLRLDHLVARRAVLGQVGLVVPHALDRVVRCLQVRIADQHDLDVVALLDRVDPLALLVQQVVRDVDRTPRDDLRRGRLACLLADQPQDRERERLHASDIAGAVAAGADRLRRLLERRAQALARELQETEAGDAPDLDPRAVLFDRLAEAVLDLPLVAVRAH